MSPSKVPDDGGQSAEGASHAIGSAASIPVSASSPQSTTPMPPAQTSPMSSTPANNGTPATGSPGFAQYSASTAAILQRLQEKGGHATGSAAFEAKKAEILQSYATSDKLPTPPPGASSSSSGSRRGGRGGRVSATPSGLKVGVGASSGRGSGRGRGRGRGRGGRGGGRGGKRKRNDSDEESENDGESDVSDSYTPLPTRTKSGRSVNKPVTFVPVIPEPSQSVKRRKSAKTMLTAKCKTCHRETDPSNNRIVFCDTCSTAYHQYCHNPPIDNEVVTVLEKEWLCTPCRRSKFMVAQAGSGQSLVSGAALSVDERRAYFSTLPQKDLVHLLITATSHHPDLPLFPPNLHPLLANSSSADPAQQQSAAQAAQNPTIPPSQPQPNTITPSLLPSSTNLLASSTTTARTPRTTMDLAGNQYEEDDGYDTDPPAHYPKAGNGLARTLRPESEDLNWLVDDNFEVFSHGWKGDGTGMGADGILEGGVGGGDARGQVE